MRSLEETELNTRSIFSFRVIESKSASLTVDLTEYVRSFEAFNLKKSDENRDKYLDLYHVLRIETSSHRSSILFEKVMGFVLEGSPLQEQEKIKKSPAYAYLMMSCIEIVKNTLDETLLKYFTLDDGSDPIATIEVKLEYNTVLDEISIYLKDNGRGFPKEFLDKMNNLEAREQYMFSKGSLKQQLLRDTGMEIRLFGGAGRGLRNLIARSDKCADLAQSGMLKEIYEMPRVSLSQFYNDAHGGAVVMVKTSLEPLQEKQQVCPPAFKLKLPKLFFVAVTEDENTPPSKSAKIAQTEEASTPIFMGIERT